MQIQPPHQKETIDIKKGVLHEEVKSEFKKLGIELVDTKPRKATVKPKQIRAADRKKMAAEEEKKAPKKAVKKESAEPKPEEKPAETKLEKELGREQ